jgi:hypothetical protein
MFTWCLFFDVVDKQTIYYIFERFLITSHHLLLLFSLECSEVGTNTLIKTWKIKTLNIMASSTSQRPIIILFWRFHVKIYVFLYILKHSLFFFIIFFLWINMVWQFQQFWKLYNSYWSCLGMMILRVERTSGYNLEDWRIETLARKKTKG